MCSLVPVIAKTVLADAQTSGGLLVALPEPELEKVSEAFILKGITGFARIGKIVKGSSRIKIL